MMTKSPNDAQVSFHAPQEGCLLTQPAEAASRNCLTQALREARPGLDEIVFLSPAENPEHEGHVVLRDTESGAVREPDAPADGSGVAAEYYAALHGFAILGTATTAELDRLLALPPAARAGHAKRAGGQLAAVVHRRFGIAGPSGAFRPSPQRHRPAVPRPTGRIRR